MNTRNRAQELFDRFVAGGEATIDQFIEQRISEELFIDYKRVTNEGESAIFEQADKENYARAISGFGNSEGGIILWGVDCRNDPQRGDVPLRKYPVKNVRRFVSFLQGATSGCTVPPHDGVQHHVVEIVGKDEGYVVSLIAKSMFAPHQCVVGKHKNRYHVRVGSNFEQASHGLLAGMFGRQQDPYVFHTWEIGAGVSLDDYSPLITFTPKSTPFVFGKFVLRNHGTTLARELYVNYVIALPGPKCVVDAHVETGWIARESVGGWHHLTAAEGFRLHPGAMVAPMHVEVYLAPPFDQMLWFEISFGCSGAPVNRIVVEVPAEKIMAAYTRFKSGDKSREERSLFARTALGLRDNGTPFEYKTNFD